MLASGARARYALPMRRLLFLAITGIGLIASAGAVPVITEFMAGNESTLADGDGNYSDWIEIHNPEGVPIALGGFGLSDGDTLWRFPEGEELAAGGFLVVFASRAGEPAYRDGSGALHATFALSLDGEPLQLLAPGGDDGVSGFKEVPAQRRDVSFGIDPVTGEAAYFAKPTPGTRNGPGLQGFVDAVAFSVARGFKDAAFDLELTTATEGAEIFYSLDGSNPAAMKVSETLIESVMVAEGAARSVHVPEDADDGLQAGGKHWSDPDFVMDGGWIEGVGPVGFDSMLVPGEYADLIGFDIGDRMRLKNASALVRISFELTGTEAVDVDFMTLSVKYDDGFVAYINGVKVAEANAPGQLDGVSTATTSHRDADALVFEDFDVSAGIAALRPGANVLAVHALNATVAGSDFFNAVELRAARHASVAISGVRYQAPIPIDGTATVRAFARKAGFADGPVATRTYLFGSDIIRQSADPEGFPDTWGEFTGTNGSVRGAPVPADYEMNQDMVDADIPGMLAALKSLPSLSIVADPDDLFGIEGILPNPFAGVDGRTGVFTVQPFVKDRQCSVEWIDPNANAANGGREMQVDCGIRLSGGWSRHYIATPKKSFSLLFKEEFGPSRLEFKLFPDTAVDSFDRIVLKAIFSDAWPDAARPPEYLRDHFLRKTLTAMGQESSHGTWVHLYLNGLYWGIYNPTERPDASFAASHYGGDKEDYDAVKHASVPGPGNAPTNRHEVVDGDSGAWREAVAIARLPLEELENYAAFTRWVDPVNLADYIILNTYTANVDWPHKNWYANRRRAEGAGWMFYPWDGEYALQDTAANLIDVNNSDTPAYFYSRARRSAEFRLLFADRVHRHLFNGGALTPEASKARYGALAAVIEPAIDAEAARWGDNGFTRKGRTNYSKRHWESARDGVLRFFDRRHDVALSQYVRAGLYPGIEAPVFSQHGGVVGEGYLLEMASSDADAGGRIYYTVDGSDPRVPRSQTGQQPARILVAESGMVSVHVPASANDGFETSGVSWTLPEFDEGGAWLQGRGPVGFESTPGGYNDLVNVHLEQPMRGLSPSALLRFPFELTAAELLEINVLSLRMKYDDGFVAHINGVEVAHANAPANRDGTAPATTSRSDTEAKEFEPFDASAAVAHLRPGMNVLAIQGFNATAGGSDFLIGAELAGGDDKAIARSADVYTGAVELGRSAVVKARVLREGDWSALSEAYFQVGAAPASADNVAITRIHYRPAAPDAVEVAAGYANRSDFEYIQLTNIGPSRVSLHGARFSDGVAFEFGSTAASELEPGATAVVVADREAFLWRFGDASAIAGQFSGKLSDDGETIQLLGDNGESIASFTYNDKAPWPESADGDGFALALTAPESRPDPGDGLNWEAVAAGQFPSRETTFAEWMTAGGFADPDARYAGAGVSNLVAFALGLDLSPVLPAAVRSGEGIAFTWQVRAGATDVRVIAEYSADLSDWSPVDPAAIVTEVQANGVSMSGITLPPGTEGFARLRIESVR